MKNLALVEGRRRAGLTQSQAAIAINVDSQTWSNWERCVFDPTPTNCKMIKKLLFSKGVVISMDQIYEKRSLSVEGS